METRNERIVPCMAIHPGHYLREELKARGISQKELALQIGMCQSHLSEFIKGKSDMNESLATRLSKALGIPFRMWMGLHHDYVCDLKAISERDAADRDAMDYEAGCTSYNLRLAYKRLYCQEKPARERVSVIKSAIAGGFSTGMYKHSPKLKCDEVQMNTWLLLNYIETHKAHTAVVYVKGGGYAAAADIARMASDSTLTEEKIKEVLEGAGIAYCVVPKVERAPIDAYSTIVGGQPVITTTHRHDDLDKLAFDVLHELCHIERHITEASPSFISIDGMDYSKDPREREADNFAKSMLIPDATWKQITSGSTKSISPHVVVKAIAERAKQSGISPTIAVSRYKHDSNWYQTSAYRSPRIR